MFINTLSLWSCSNILDILSFQILLFLSFQKFLSLEDLIFLMHIEAFIRMIVPLISI